MAGIGGATGAAAHESQPQPTGDAPRTDAPQLPTASAFPATSSAAGGVAVLRAPTPAFVRNVLAAVVALNVGFLCGTLVFLNFFRQAGSDWKTAPKLKYVLVQLHLGAENVLATWYSSMLLLAVAAAFLWCFLADGARLRTLGAARFLRFGWLVLAAGFVGLSLDEIGSLHERIGTANPLRDYPLNWFDPLAIPLIAALLFMGLFAFAHVARRRAASMLLIGIGAALILFVAGFEHVEEHLWPVASDHTEVAKPFWYPLIEEGTELVAVTAFLAAALIYLCARRSERSGPTEPARDVPAPVRVSGKTLTVATIVFVALLAVLYAGVRALLEHARAGDNGIPQNWFPAALAALASLVCVLAGFRGQVREHRQGYVACATFFLVLSAYYGAHLRFWLSEFGGGRYRGLFEGAIVALAVVTALALARLAERRWSRIATAAAALMLAVAIARGASYPGALDPLALALLLLALTPHVMRDHAAVQSPA